VAFVQRQLGNSRNAVKKKAAAFLKKHAPSGEPGRPANGRRAIRSKTNPALPAP
jgi:hypothetical protein